MTRVNGSKLHSQDFDADGAQNCTKSTVGQTSPPNKDTKFSHLYDFSLYECMIKILSSAESSFLEKNKIKNPSCKFLDDFEWQLYSVTLFLSSFIPILYSFKSINFWMPYFPQLHLNPLYFLSFGMGKWETNNEAITAHLWHEKKGLVQLRER